MKLLLLLVVLARSAQSTNRVVFQDGPPGPRWTTSYAPSACANGGGQWDAVAFACPHMAMLTDDMLAAAEHDGLVADFVYAVAGGASDGDCGACYQVRPLQAERHWRPDFPQLIVQIVNSGFDVMSGQMDLFVGAGGMGYFTAVNRDCASRFCNGGPCTRGMFGGDFAAWSNAQYSDPHLCYEGGVKWDNTSDIWDLCRRLSGGEEGLKDRVLWDSCARSNLGWWHQNFYETQYERVACPLGLVSITGLWRSDDDHLPVPHVSNPLTQSCRGSLDSGHACLTTMHDGCVPSCSWPGKVGTVQGYGSVDRCDAQGQVLA